MAAIHRSLELGVNWIDTAAVYGLGHSEEVVARALKDWHGSKPIFFTKCGLRWDGKGEVQKVLSATRSAAKSKTVFVAFPSMQLISTKSTGLLTRLCRPGRRMVHARHLKREGKVRWIGVSNFNVQQLASRPGHRPVTSLQPRYSLVHREIEDEILPYCLSEGIGVIVYSRWLPVS